MFTNMSPRIWPAPAAAVDELQLLTTMQPNRDEHLFPQATIRPLDAFSDYVVTLMPIQCHAVLTGQMSPHEFMDEAETVFATVDPGTIEDLMRKPGTTSARTARLDIAYLERALCVSHGGPTQQYRAKRAHSPLFKAGVRLANSQDQQLFLGWPDIANRYPVHDPRTFSPPGPGRNHEVMLFRVQSSIERVFQHIVVEWPTKYISPKVAEQIACELDAVVNAMIHISLVREVGEFDSLNRFLTPNGEAHGHASGAFSAWTFLVDYLLTGEVLDRLINPENRWAFDADARCWIDAMIAGELTPLPAMRGSSPDIAEIEHLTTTAVRLFGRFHEVHRGALRRHAAGALHEQAPSNRLLTNIESINEIIATTKRLDQRDGRRGEPDSVA